MLDDVLAVNDRRQSVSLKPRPVIQVSFPSQTTSEALCDTGADISVIREDVLAQLTPSDIVRRQGGNCRRVNCANGTSLRLAGSVLLRFSVGGREFVHEFIVCNNLRSSIILGIDFIITNGLAMLSRTKTLFWQDGHPARARQQLSLGPNEVRLLELESDMLMLGNTDILFEPAHATALEGVVRRGNKFLIPVCNGTNEAVTIRRGEEIGSLAYCVETSEDKLASEVARRSPSSTEDEAIRIDLRKVPAEIRPYYVRLIEQHKAVFAAHTYDVGHCRVLPQRIVLKDPDRVSSTPPYRLAEHLRPVAEEYVKNLASAGIIQPSNSPYSSPLMLVRKGDASPSKPLIEQYRVVHDYRRLNDNTVKDSYPMRQLYELLDRVANAKVWSVIDLSSGFWNQELEPGSRALTAFGLPGLGHWEYKRSAQGLCNSPAAFQRLLDYVLRGLDRVYVYIDDVIVCSNNHEEHLKLLHQVFLRFEKFSLRCKPSKIQLGAGEVKYLGYDLSRTKGVQAGKAKVEAIGRWEAPRNLTEIRRFLGTCSFFRRTIPHFASIASPLTRLTRQDSGYLSGELPPDAQESFRVLKQKLCERPCLAPVDFNREFIVTTDASGVGLGCILSQVGEDGLEHPCACRLMDCRAWQSIRTSRCTLSRCHIVIDGRSNMSNWTTRRSSNSST